LKRYRVDVSPEARIHVQAIQAWWTTNRRAAPDLFREELRAALATLSESPAAGTPYRISSGVAGMRRILMPRTRYHVYYVVTDEQRRVLVHAVWHTARGRGPRLP
jgi:plasmid stabilization system protein ParE